MHDNLYKPLKRLIYGGKKRTNPSLRIFENFCHYTFSTFAIHTGKHTIPKSQEISLLPPDKGEVNFRTFASSLNNL